MDFEIEHNNSTRNALRIQAAKLSSNLDNTHELRPHDQGSAAHRRCRIPSGSPALRASHAPSRASGAGADPSVHGRASGGSESTRIMILS